MQADCALEQTLGASQVNHIHVNASQTDNHGVIIIQRAEALGFASFHISSQLLKLQALPLAMMECAQPTLPHASNHLFHLPPINLGSSNKKPEHTHTYCTAAASCPCGGDCLHGGCATGIWGCSETLNPCLSWNSKNLNYKTSVSLLPALRHDSSLQKVTDTIQGAAHTVRSMIDGFGAVHEWLLSSPACLYQICQAAPQLTEALDQERRDHQTLQVRDFDFAFWKSITAFETSVYEKVFKSIISAAISWPRSNFSAIWSLLILLPRLLACAIPILPTSWPPYP